MGSGDFCLVSMRCPLHYVPLGFGSLSNNLRDTTTFVPLLRYYSVITKMVILLLDTDCDELPFFVQVLLSH